MRGGVHSLRYLSWIIKSMSSESVKLGCIVNEISNFVYDKRRSEIMLDRASSIHNYFLRLL